MIEEEVLTILYFAIPGVLTELYLRQYRPARPKSDQFELYLIVVCSIFEWCVYFLALSLLSIIYSKIPTSIKQQIPPIVLQYGNYILMLGIIFACSFCIKKWNKFGKQKLLPLDTAWDNFFLKGSHVFVEVHLVDGDIIFGEYSSRSYASSDSEDRDIYLERIFEVDDSKEPVFDNEDNPIEVEGNNGILILKEQIKYIIFFKDEA